MTVLNRIASTTLLWLLAMAGFELFAQDLDTEVLPDEQLIWQKIEGQSPKIRACKLSSKGAIQCLSDQRLQLARCEAFHFSKKTPLKGVLANKGFKCDGTRFDHKSLMSQWVVTLIAVDGSQSKWRVEAIDSEQMHRLFKAELESQPFLKKQRNSFFSLKALSHYEGQDSGSPFYNSGIESMFGNTRFQFGLRFTQSSQNIVSDRNNLLFVGNVALDTKNRGAGWLLGLEFGQKRYLESSTQVQCLSGKYRWGPGNWRTELGLGNCWYPSKSLRLAPKAEVLLGRFFWDYFLLGAHAEAVYRIANRGESSGYKYRAGLTVSFELFPE